MPSILCVGDEIALNRSRAAVLRTTGCHVVEAESSAAIPLLNTLAYDMVVLCHTVWADTASRITAHAAILAREPLVVRIDSPFGASVPPSSGVVRIDPDGGPRVLVEAVRRAFDLPMGDSDGHAYRTDGAASRTDGAATRTDGAVSSTDGAATSTDGAATRTDGAATRTDGAASRTDGAATRTDGAASEPQPVSAHRKPAAATIRSLHR